jgi:hypothetical protein
VPVGNFPVFFRSKRKGALQNFILQRALPFLGVRYKKEIIGPASRR